MVAPDAETAATIRAGLALALSGVSLRHPGAARPAVGPLDLEIRPGERVLLLGPSGCGKSSLIQAITGIVPVTRPGTVTGTTILFGQPAQARPPSDWADHVGTLLQSAEEVLIGPRIRDDIAFGPEALGLAPAIVAERVARAMHLAGVAHLDAAGPVATLSGGEKQRVALAGILALDPALLILDEPTAQLDPEATRLVHALLDRVGTDWPACLIVDHRLDGLVERIDRVLVLGPDGQRLAEGMPASVFHQQGDRLDQAGVWRPLACHAVAALAVGAPALVMADLARSLPRDAGLRRRSAEWLATLRPPRLATAPGKGAPIVSLSGAAIAPPGGPVVLSGVDLSLRTGERVGIAGRNGSGKSSLAATLAGLRRPVAGSRTGEPGWLVLQNPEHHSLGATVAKDLSGALRASGRVPDDAAMEALAARWGLSALLSRHPLDLSQGEKRRLSLALAEAGPERACWILDEPTHGLDAAATRDLIGALDGLVARGIASVVISHDMDVLARCCDRLVVLGEGRVLADGPMESILANRDLLARAGLARPTWAPLADWLEGWA